MDTDKRVLTEKELSTCLGLSLPTLQRMRSKGGGPKFIMLSFPPVGYRPSDVENWLVTRTAECLRATNGGRSHDRARKPTGERRSGPSPPFPGQSRSVADKGESYINMIWSEVNPAQANRSCSGRACRTIEEATRVLNWIRSQPGKREILRLHEFAADGAGEDQPATVTST